MASDGYAAVPGEGLAQELATTTVQWPVSAYLAALEKEFDKLRLFLIHSYNLPAATGAPPSDARIQSPETAEANATAASAPPMIKGMSVADIQPLTEDQMEHAEPYPVLRQNAGTLLGRCAQRLARAKNKTGKGSARRVKDYWEEIKNFPPPMQYQLSSVPWKRLLTDWAQGNPKKLDYMSRWLKNVLEGGKIENGPFPMGVELKSVTPMMLDGFMQLIIPKLAERPDINVHVHTKEFIGTSMRITLSVRKGVVPMKPRSLPASSPSGGVRERLSKAQAHITGRNTNPQASSPSPSDGSDQWDRSSIRSIRN